METGLGGGKSPSRDGVWRSLEAVWAQVIVAWPGGVAVKSDLDRMEIHLETELIGLDSIRKR